MTINGQGQLLYRSIEIDSKLIYYIVQQQYELQKGNNSRKRPKVVIDANLVGFLFLFKGIGPARAVFFNRKRIFERVY